MRVNTCARCIYSGPPEPQALPDKPSWRLTEIGHTDGMVVEVVLRKLWWDVECGGVLTCDVECYVKHRSGM